MELVAATDVDSPLTGLFGATKTFGPQKGLAEERLVVIDGCLESWRAGHRPACRAAARAPEPPGDWGSRAAARRRPAGRASRWSPRPWGWPARARAADLVLTGEGAFDFSSRSGKVPYGVAEIAAEALRPCVALAGQVLVGAREMRALGVESAYSLVDLVGERAGLRRPRRLAGRPG